MARTSSIKVSNIPNTGMNVFPSSLDATIFPVILAGGVTVQDAATITNVETQITAATRRGFLKAGAASIMQLFVSYSSGLTAITSPKVKVFGKTEISGWRVLKSKAGATNVELTMVVASDATDGTLSISTIDPSTQTWDLFGCTEVVVGIETALAATGTTSTATIQAILL